VAVAPLGVLAAPASAGSEIGLPPATDDVSPFRLRVPEGALSDLRRRLAATRWPERETVPDGSQGAQLERVRRLARYWQTRYDWRRVEARLNGFGQFRTRLDGLGIHFLHVRSRHPNALPLVLTHGWPGSVVEFLNVIRPMTDPTAFGGTPDDAFHVVVPSLPGFGFSDKPTAPGWNIQRIARAWVELMRRLGYERYIAQGGDWGAAVTNELGSLKPVGLAGIHLNFFFAAEPPVVGEPTPEEKEAIAKLKKFQTDGVGYFTEQATRPQQVGYGLTDSPVGQAAWIYEKFVEWTDSDNDPESVLGYDQMLDDIMLYWLPATAASSARIYWEFGRGGTLGAVGVPVGFTTFPGELVPAPRVWVERVFMSNLIYFNRVARGGHFAAFEQPAIFTEELRRFARLLR
jgi:pimeloyl-ACP methyl ester carboxylesterase